MALCTLWIAQPLYDLVGGTPDYFLVRGLGASDIWLFALLAFLLPPLALVVAAETLGAIGRRIGRPGVRYSAYATLVGALGALGLLLVLRLAAVSWGVPVPSWLPGPVAVLAAVVSARLLRLAAVRRILALIALLAPVAPLLFLLRPEIRAELTTPLHSVGGTEDTAGADRSAVVPVVVLVLDELPLYTLLDTEGAINARLFPHLAEFARSAGWYRGAVTPRYFTQHAVPALVAGMLGEEQSLATARSYPRSLLTLLRRSHRVLSDEPITALDPDRPLAPRNARLAAMASDSALVLARAALPPEWTAGLPERSLRAAVGQPRDPTERFEAFLDRVEKAASRDSDGRPLLVFSHLLLPHHPWLRDETGALYDAGDEILIDGLEEPEVGALRAVWRDDWETVLDAYERHLLQTRHADRLVGRLFAVLRRQGLFDRSLIVVAADHGIHFGPGEPPRQATDGNAESLARVPLLVKTPGQTEGFVDDAPRSTLDVLPTVLGVLGRMESEEALPGTSLLDAPMRRPDPPTTEPAPFQALREKWRERERAAGPDGFGLWHERLAGSVLRIGGVPTREWVVDIDRVGRFASVDPRLPRPRRLSGRLLPRRPEALQQLVQRAEALPLGVAVDGVMVASTRTSVPREGDADVPFSLLLPASALAPGEHQVIIYLLAFEGDLFLPLPIPRPLEPQVRLDGVFLLAENPQGKATRLRLRSADDMTGEAVTIRFDGATAAMEIFGRVAGPEGTQVDQVLVFYDGLLLAQAEWIGDGDLGRRYQLEEPASAVGSDPASRLFRTVVPVMDVVDDLRVVAVFSTDGGDRRGVELPLRLRRESVWRVTGPFWLRHDPHRPSPAFQNF